MLGILMALPLNGVSKVTAIADTGVSILPLGRAHRQLKVMSEEEATSSDSDDEEYVMPGKDFKNSLKKEEVCDCPKHSFNDQEAFIVGCWSDSGYDSKKKEICLMALDNNDVLSDTPYYSSSSLDNESWENEFTALLLTTQLAVAVHHTTAITIRRSHHQQTSQSPLSTKLMVTLTYAKWAKNARNAVADLKSKGASAVGVASFCWRGMTVSKLSSFGEIKAAVILHPGPLSDDDINGHCKICFAKSNLHGYGILPGVVDTSEEEQKRQGVWDAAQGGSTSATEYSNKNLASLYHPPFALMFNGPFEKAKEAANRQDRWLLVNVQSTKEFNSHMVLYLLSLFSEITVYVTSTMTRMKIYDDTEEGSKISTYYRLDSGEVPVTIVIDPITGKKKHLWRGLIYLESLLEVDNFVQKLLSRAEFHVGAHVRLKVNLELDEWIKDSGCSRHMTGNKYLFSSYKTIDGGNVVFGGNTKSKIVGKGQICDKKCKVLFSETDSEIIKDDITIGRGIRKNGLYIMKMGNDDTSTLWHRRLGHANMRLIQSLSSKELVRNLPKLKFEPKNVKEAIQDESWTMAMQEELNHYKTNDVWSLVPPPNNQTIIGTKWVFKNKLDENGVVSRNKARLVAQGYNQQEGIDFDETYALVAKLESIRILLAYACAHDFKLFQMDVKSDFLKGFINVEVYVAQPPRFIDFEKLNHVFKLKNALYGLKQAPKAWYDRLKAFLIDHKYTMRLVDNTLFTKKRNSHIIIVQIYVEDIIFGSTYQELCDDFMFQTSLK
ncbi:retrovirus-related pol polyprotein from transposon TNT 1-94 [Tanacetum coccineum]|uniref:Retrovirus-related pol polyprotein from transposon TNT 1-94 n=1 Tax=Tanacetum coccineum TaxID=301880 RepID=A0ABQ5DHP6_9ASTR